MKMSLKRSESFFSAGIESTARPAVRVASLGQAYFTGSRMEIEFRPIDKRASSEICWCRENTDTKCYTVLQVTRIEMNQMEQNEKRHFINFKLKPLILQRIVTLFPLFLLFFY